MSTAAFTPPPLSAEQASEVTGAPSPGTFTPPPLSSAQGEDPGHAQASSVLDAAQRFGQGFYDKTVKGLVDTASAAGNALMHPQQTVSSIANSQAVHHPLDTAAQAVKNSYNTHMQMLQQAQQAFKNGDYEGAVQHATNAMIPVLGPQIQASTDKIKSGDVAGGVGELAGMAASLAAMAPGAPEAAGKAIGDLAESTGARDAISGAANSAATKLYQSALKPSTAAPARAAAAVQAGLKNAIPVSESGSAKLAGLIQNWNDDVERTIASNPSATVSPGAVANRLDQVRQKFANQVLPQADLNVIDKARQEWLGRNTGRVRPPVNQTINNRDLLYHATTPAGLDGILQSGEIIPSKTSDYLGGQEPLAKAGQPYELAPYGVSMSRAPGVESMENRPVVLELDRSKVPNTVPVAEQNYPRSAAPGEVGSEAEERTTGGQTVPAAAIRSVLIDRDALEGLTHAAQPDLSADALDQLTADRVDQISRQAAANGLPVKVMDDADQLRQYRAKMGEGQKALIPIPAAKAQAIKQGTYAQLKSQSYGQLKSAEVESQKALARGIKEELEQQFPELSQQNANLSSAYNLQPYLEKAIGRISNHNVLSLGDMVAAGAGAAAEGPMGAGVAALMRHIVGSPEIKSRLAIALTKAAGGSAPAGLASAARVNSYIQSLDGALSRGATTATAPAPLPLAASGNQQTQ